MEKLHVSIFLSLLATCALIDARCNFPPSLWCSSPAVARSCGVSQQCQSVFLPELKADMVNFTLYYESLCPDCKIFISKQLWPTYIKIGQIMNLTIVPYGNARETKVGDKWNYECQHGPQECVGNLIDTCALNIFKTFNESFTLIACMEESTMKPGDAAQMCAKKFAIDIGPIMQCANGDMGNELEHQMAMRTNALNPPHKYVPWVTLNGVHNELIQRHAERDLMKLICDTYKGEKPAACMKKTHRGCYQQ